MLQKKIRQTLARRKDIDQRRLARLAGTSESTLSRYLNGFEELNFESCLKIVKHLYAEQEIEMMSQHVLTLRSKNARHALEYCMMNRLYPQCDELIANLSSSSNPVDKEWASMYLLIRQRTEQTLNLMELLKQVEVFNPKELEMQFMKAIMKGYIYFDMQAYNSIFLHTKEIEDQLEKVRSSFIRHALKAHFGLVMSKVSLYGNDVMKARAYSRIVIDQMFFEHIKATAYFSLGYSFLFEDYELAYRCLDDAKHLYEKYDDERGAYSSTLALSFLQSYWQMEKEFTFELNGPLERMDYIYYFIQKGDVLQAKNLAQQVDICSVPDRYKGFIYYFLGLIHDDRDAFYESVRCFKAMGDYFHCQLPIKELYQRNENEIVLRLLATNIQNVDHGKIAATPLYV